MPVEPVFSPAGKWDCRRDTAIKMGLDEYEAIRLIDLLGMTQEECAAQMKVARTTVTGIYENARQKIAQALVLGKPLMIEGGHCQICGRTDCDGRKKGRNGNCPMEKLKKGEGIVMRIAVTYENGEIFGHFGHTEQFKLYDIKEGKVVSAQVVDTNGTGHGALAGMLKELEVTDLICGGIGGGARNALEEAGIHLYGGVSGEADAAVEALLNGELEYNPEVSCDHHGQHHHHHGEGCGSNCRHGNC